MGSQMYKSLANEAEEDYLEMEICQQLRANAEEFKTLACELLAQCYETDDDMTLQLLTYELRQFNKSTCISLAALSGNETFVAHQSCQLLLADLWLGGLRLRKSVNLKVVAGIFCPPFIALLTFKTKEELQLQAQTAEESETYRGPRMERKKSWQDDSSSISSCDDETEIDSNEFMDDEELTKFDESTSIEMSPNFPHRQALFVTAEDQFSTPVQTMTVKFSPTLDDKAENPRPNTQRRLSGPLWTDDMLLAAQTKQMKELHATTSFSCLEDENNLGRFKKLPKPFKRFATTFELESVRLGPQQLLDKPPIIPKNRPKHQQQLEIGRKILEFYSAPITAFWSFTISYVIFLSFFTFVVLVKTPPVPEWPEYYVIAYMATYSIDQLRKILLKEPRNLKGKLQIHFSSLWDYCTAVACVEFFLALFLRLHPDTLYVGRVLYCINIVFWYLRVLRIMCVNSALSPYIIMYGKMVERLFLLSTILFVTLASFGVLRQSIVVPDQDWQWSMLRNMTYKPYWYLYGSLYPDEITECGDSGTNCVPGFWLTPLFMTLYLLLAIVVFMNMMVAAFSHIFNDINDRAQEVTKFEAYHQVMDFEQQPFLPPPLVVLAHLYIIGKYFYKKCCKRERKYRIEHSLKLFLPQEEKEKLHEFERDCLAELLARKKDRIANSMESRLQYFSERLDSMSMQMDYLYEQDRVNQTALSKLENHFSSSSSSTGLKGSSATVATYLRSNSDTETTSRHSDANTPNDHGTENQKHKSNVISTIKAKYANNSPVPSRFRFLSEHDTMHDSDSGMRSRSGSAPSRPSSWNGQKMRNSPLALEK